MSLKILIAAFAVLSTAENSHAKLQCSSRAVAALHETFPGARLRSCKETHDRNGRLQVEMSAESRDSLDAKLFLDGNGKVILSERSIETDSLPSLVFDGFGSRYPNTNFDGAEKLTDSLGTVSYGVEFTRRGKAVEAVFAPDGRLIEEVVPD